MKAAAQYHLNFTLTNKVVCYEVSSRLQVVIALLMDGLTSRKLIDSKCFHVVSCFHLHVRFGIKSYRFQIAATNMNAFIKVMKRC